MAPIAVGDVIPDGTLSYFDEEDKVQAVNIHSLAVDKKVILFGVPGAFTPTCSLKHVPGFIEKADELKSKGVDKILVLALKINMNPYEDELFFGFCYGFSCNDPQELLEHMIVNHDHAPEVQGLKAAENSKRYTICVSNNDYQHSKIFTSQKALESYMDSIHLGWEASYPNCQKKNCHRVFLNQ